MMDRHDLISEMPHLPNSSARMETAMLVSRIELLEALLGKTLAFLPPPADGVPEGAGLRDRVLKALDE